MFKFLGVQRASAMKVNAHVRLESTLILRMPSFQSTLLFFLSTCNNITNYRLSILTLFPSKVIIIGTSIVSQSANSGLGNLYRLPILSSEFNGESFWAEEVSCK